MLKYRGVCLIAMLADRNIGFLSRCWLSIAGLIYRYVGLSRGWHIVVLAHRDVAHRDVAFRDVGLSRCWLIAMLAYCGIGLSCCWLIVMLFYREVDTSFYYFCRSPRINV